MLLSANVALLAIGSIDASTGNPHRNVAQVACYASTILALACYIICWILSRRHPPDGMTTASDAVSNYAFSAQELKVMYIQCTLGAVPFAPQKHNIWFGGRCVDL